MVSLEYLAGFFDGEGCITIGKNGSLSVRVINTNKDVLDRFVERLGGSIQERKQIVNKKQYVWSTYGDAAVNALDHLEAYLIEKQGQAQTAIQWMKSERYQYLTVSTGKRGGMSHPERSNVIKKYQTILTKQKLGTHIE